MQGNSEWTQDLVTSPEVRVHLVCFKEFGEAVMNAVDSDYVVKDQMRDSCEPQGVGLGSQVIARQLEFVLILTSHQKLWSS